MSGGCKAKSGEFNLPLSRWPPLAGAGAFECDTLPAMFQWFPSVCCPASRSPISSLDPFSVSSCPPLSCLSSASCYTGSLFYTDLSASSFFLDERQSHSLFCSHSFVFELFLHTIAQTYTPSAGQLTVQLTLAAIRKHIHTLQTSSLSTLRYSENKHTTFDKEPLS
jgi:hypothetical protein